MSEKRACIIGAGSSGIAAAKILKERGIPFDCFEAGSDIGGVWRYENDTGVSPAYASLHCNTSGRETAYSDFPMPDDYPDFPHHTQMLAYFESYVDHFGLRDSITFGARVTEVAPGASGGWDVTVEDRTGARRQQNYEAVLVASGHHWQPHMPVPSGNYTGKILHARDYRGPDDFWEKRVLVVGIGNSACDIVCELAWVSARAVLSTRRGAHIVPRYIYGRPIDQICPPWLWRIAPLWVLKNYLALGLYVARGSLESHGLPRPQHRLLEEHPSISTDLPNLVRAGKISCKPAISRCDGLTVRFDDGSDEAIDAIIFATGYQVSFPFLDRSLVDPQDNRLPLYKRVVHPDLPGLYFIALLQPLGAMMPLAEVQSRWVADLLDGTAALPRREAMLGEIARAEQELARRYTNSRRHTMQVDFYPYLAEIQREIRRGRNRVRRQDR